MAYINTGVISISPDQSKTKSGIFSFSYMATNPSGQIWDVAGQFTVTLYASSVATTAYPRLASTWKNIGERVLASRYNNGQFINVQYQIDSTGFVDARSFAIRLSTPTGANTKIEFNPIALSYYTSYNILDSGTGIGSFYYLAMDGGFK